MTDNEISPQKNFSTDIDPHIGETTEVSWTPPDEMTEEGWTKIGYTLQTVYQSMRWWLGDWLNSGESKYGETYAQAIIVTDSALETLKKYKSVSQRISKEDRIADLSWTHHFYVAYLPQNEHNSLLSMAYFHQLTSREFRSVIELPDEERSHLIDLWINFDGPEHVQTLMALRTLEKFGTIYLPDERKEEDEEELPFPDPPEVDVEIDGEQFRYKTNSGGEVFEFWEKKGMPMTFSDHHSAEWEGIRVVSIIGEDGDPILLWDMLGMQ